jgi:hypothetical protein
LVICDVVESPSNNEGSIGQAIVLGRRGVYGPLIGDVAPNGIFDSNVSGVQVAFRGGVWAQVTSTGVAQRIGATANNTRVRPPIGVDVAGLAAAAVMPMRFDLSILVHRATPLVAVVPFGLVMEWDPGSPPANLLDTTTTRAGFQVASRSDVNGGRWTTGRRLTDGGAFVAGTDSGVDPADGFPHRIGIRYEHSTNPRLVGLVDGVEVGPLLGLAAIPSSTVLANLFRTSVVQDTTGGAAAGQVDRYVQARLTITQLPGF